MSQGLETLFTGSRSVQLSAGAVLFRSAAPVSEMFMVNAGQVHLCRHTVHGAELVLQRAMPGMIVAEASAYSDRYHCDATAATDCVVLALPKPVFLSALAADAGFAASWAATLARGVQAARFRSEIRSLPKVADRLDAWLGEGNHLPQKGHWQDVANELGVAREALYRELARRRNERAG
ncbi:MULTISPECIES: Crp/Fnr family transcriptional regulator [Roseobacteraceae]|nr:MULTISPECIES: Crp/Fnr family transcriptional regulator [Roseobacteraceae]